MILIGLKKFISYVFLISKIKDLGVGIIIGFKKTLLKKRIARAMPFYKKKERAVNCSYFLQFKIKAKKY